MCQLFYLYHSFNPKHLKGSDNGHFSQFTGWETEAQGRKLITLTVGSPGI